MTVFYTMEACKDGKHTECKRKVYDPKWERPVGACWCECHRKGTSLEGRK